MKKGNTKTIPPSVLLLFFLATLVPRSFGADKDGNFVIVGGPVSGGVWSCGDWHAAEPAKTNISRTVQTAWLYGYISGVNAAAPGSGVRVSGTQIRAFIDHYCAQNPLHQLVQAADALIEEAGGRKSSHTWRK